MLHPRAMDGLRNPCSAIVLLIISLKWCSPPGTCSRRIKVTHPSVFRKGNNHVSGERFETVVEEPAQWQDEEVSGRVRDVFSQPFSHALPSLLRTASTRWGRAAFLGWALAAGDLREWSGKQYTEDRVVLGSSLWMKTQKFLGTSPSSNTDSQSDAGQESKGGNPASLKDTKNSATVWVCTSSLNGIKYSETCCNPK